jgi:hypothetical protein
MHLFPVCRKKEMKTRVIGGAWRRAWSGSRTTAELLDSEVAQHGSRQPIGQRQSKLDRAVFHRDLIVGIELQKKDPRVSGYQNGQVVYKQPPETTDERRFESLVRTSSSGADRTERTLRGFSGTSPSRLQLTQRFRHS